MNNTTRQHGKGFAISVIDLLRRTFGWPVTTVSIESEPEDDFISESPFDDLTWTCHVCGEEREDRFISVVRHQHPIFDGGGATVTCNVRYCHDRLDCFRQALVEVCHFGKRGG